MPIRMVTLLWFDDFGQAEYYREQLEDAGINAAIIDDREESDELEKRGKRTVAKRSDLG